MYLRTLFALGTLLASLTFTLLIFECSYLDLRIQDLFYKTDSGQWLIPREAALVRAFCYHGMKYGVILIGLSALVACCLPTRIRRGPVHLSGIPRRAFLGVVIMIVSLPSFVGFLKSNTDVYFPSQVERYGGSEPYFRLFDDRPGNREPGDRGRGFPAGHASGGFALISLVFISPPSRRRKVLLFALAYGSIMAAYQTLNGAHYVSHSLVTVHLAFIFLIVIGAILRLPIINEIPHES